MNTEQHLKILLSRLIESEIEYVDFIHSCLKDIFDEDYELAKWKFEEMVQYRDECGCLQTIDYIKRRVNEDLERREQYKNKIAKEKEDADGSDA